MLIYDKTDLGRQEISHRSVALPARLRTLLVMVDGRAHADALVDKLAVLGVEAADLDDLAQRGLIVARPVELVAEAEAPPRPAARLRRGMRPARSGLRTADEPAGETVAHSDSAPVEVEAGAQVASTAG